MYIAVILTSNRTDCCLINFFVPILCCYFAHDYRNRPFCSPAFIFEMLEKRRAGSFPTPLLLYYLSPEIATYSKYCSCNYQPQSV